MKSFTKILKSVVLPFGALLVLAIGLRFVIAKAGNSLADRFVSSAAPMSLAAPTRLPHRKSLRPKAAPIPTIAAPQLPPETEADRQVIAQAQQEAGVWAQTSLQTTLKPVPSGNGLIVFEPIATDAALADFGAGCGRWLHLMVAGQSALGKTPL